MTAFLPSMPVMVRDFMSSASVAAMTNEQLGAFMRLLFCAWMSSPPCTLPDDDRQLATMAQMSLRRWQSVGLVMKQRFPVLDDGRRRNEKQWTQWQYAQTAARTNQERGRKAAEAKAAKAAARRRAQEDRDGDRDGGRQVDRDVDRGDPLENNSELTISNQQSKDRSQIRTGGVISRTEDGANTESPPPALWRQLWERRWPDGICRTSARDLDELERLAVDLGCAEVAARVGRYLATNDDWLCRHKHPLRTFLRQINSYDGAKDMQAGRAEAVEAAKALKRVLWRAVGRDGRLWLEAASVTRTGATVQLETTTPDKLAPYHDTLLAAVREELGGDVELAIVAAEEGGA